MDMLPSSASASVLITVPVADVVCVLPTRTLELLVVMTVSRMVDRVDVVPKGTRLLLLEEVYLGLELVDVENTGRDIDLGLSSLFTDTAPVKLTVPLVDVEVDKFLTPDCLCILLPVLLAVSVVLDMALPPAETT